jgi:5-methyltetrahydropteroyltriglutamate--homocysteine methyltransferase
MRGSQDRPSNNRKKPSNVRIFSVDIPKLDGFFAAKADILKPKWLPTEIDYAELLPSLFMLRAGIFYLQLASEPDRKRVLKMVREHSKPEQRIFVGVTDPLDPRVETPDEVRDRVLEAAEYIPLDRLGTTDDCGFAPFSDDTSRSREVAFAKVRSRVMGTALAADMLGIN